MATFNKRVWKNDEAPPFSAETFNELEADIQAFGDDIVTELKSSNIVSDKSVEYTVTEETSIFELPSNVANYADTSYYIICAIDGVETTAYTLGEQNLVQILTLTTPITTGKVVIRAIQFKSSFLDFIAKNIGVG